MSRNGFDIIIDSLLSLILALIWVHVLVIPGEFLIHIITNSIIYRKLYVAIMFVVGGVLIAIIIVKGTLKKRIDDYLREMIEKYDR